MPTKKPKGPFPYADMVAGYLNRVNPAALAGSPSYQKLPVQPPDPQLEAYKTQQGLNRNVSDLEATYQRGNIGQEYGYNAEGARDYSNPYARAALLEENFKRAQLGTTNSMASAGQLNSGAYGRAQNENARGYSIADDRLRRDASSAFRQISLGQADNAIQYGAGTGDEALKALIRALGGQV